MSMPFICPVCGGEGKLLNDGTTSDALSKVCHGCGGKGWVEVSCEPLPTLPYYPQPYDSPPIFYWNGPNSIPNGDFNKPK